MAIYSCNDGFVLDLSVGSEKRTCIENNTEGIFDLIAPICVRKSSRHCLMIVNQEATYNKASSPGPIFGRPTINRADNK